MRQLINEQTSRKFALTGFTLAYFELYFSVVFSRLADAEFMSAAPHSIVNGIHALFESMCRLRRLSAEL